MPEHDDYTPAFEAERLPIWYLNKENRDVAHLYPDCGYMKNNSEYERRNSTVEFGGFDSGEEFEEWKSQKTLGRTLCEKCLNKLQKDMARWSMQNNEPLPP